MNEKNYLGSSLNPKLAYRGSVLTHLKACMFRSNTMVENNLRSLICSGADTVDPLQPRTVVEDVSGSTSVQEEELSQSGSSVLSRSGAYPRRRRSTRSRKWTQRTESQMSTIIDPTLIEDEYTEAGRVSVGLAAVLNYTSIQIGQFASKRTHLC